MHTHTHAHKHMSTQRAHTYAHHMRTHERIPIEIDPAPRIVRGERDSDWTSATGWRCVVTWFAGSPVQRLNRPGILNRFTCAAMLASTEERWVICVE